MAKSDLQATVEDCHSDDSASPEIDQRKRSKSNISSKRSHPSDLGKDNRADAPSEAATDSGYSSKSAASVNSYADSTRSAKREKAPSKTPSVASSKTSKTKSSSKPPSQSTHKPTSSSANTDVSEKKRSSRSSSEKEHPVAQQAPVKTTKPRASSSKPPQSRLDTRTSHCDCHDCNSKHTPQSPSHGGHASHRSSKHFSPQEPSSPVSRRTSVRYNEGNAVMESHRGRRPSVQGPRPVSFAGSYPAVHHQGHGPPLSNSAWANMSQPPPPGYGHSQYSVPNVQPFAAQPPAFGYTAQSLYPPPPPPPSAPVGQAPSMYSTRSAPPSVYPTPQPPNMATSFLGNGASSVPPSARRANNQPAFYDGTSESETGSESDDAAVVTAEKHRKRISPTEPALQGIRKTKQIMGPPALPPQRRQSVSRRQRDSYSDGRQADERSIEYEDEYEEDDLSSTRASAHRGSSHTSSVRRPSLASTNRTNGTKATSYSGSGGSRVYVEGDRHNRRRSYHGGVDRRNGYDASDIEGLSAKMERLLPPEEGHRTRSGTIPQRSGSQRHPERETRRATENKTRDAEAYQEDNVRNLGYQQRTDNEFRDGVKKSQASSQRSGDAKSRVSQMTKQTNGEITLHLQDAQDYSVSIGDGMEGKVINLSAAEGGGMNLIVSDGKTGSGRSYHGSEPRSTRYAESSAPSRSVREPYNRGNDYFQVPRERERERERERDRDRVPRASEMRGQPRRPQPAIHQQYRGDRRSNYREDYSDDYDSYDDYNRRF